METEIKNSNKELVYIIIWLIIGLSAAGFIAYTVTIAENEQIQIEKQCCEFHHGELFASGTCLIPINIYENTFEEYKVKIIKGTNSECKLIK